MPYKQKTAAVLVLLVITGMLVTGCGAIATPRPPGPPTPEPVTLAPTRDTGAAEAGGEVGEVTEPPTEAPTATAVPPTATPTVQPPTSTPSPTPTALPTETPDSVGDAAQGEILFANGKDAAPGCVTCHVVEEDRVLIGPSMVGIAARAGTRVEGQSAEEYLRLSIVAPNDYLVPNTEVNVFAAGGNSLMFQQYEEYLTETDVDNLVAYMLTLE